MTRREPRAARRRPPWRTAVDAAVLTGLVGLATTPLLPAFGGAPGVPAVVVGLVTGTALALLGRWGRWSALVVTAAAVVLVGIVGGPVIGAPTLLGVVPTLPGLQQVATAVVSTWKDVLTLAPPLGGVGDVVMAPYLLAFVGALVAVSVAVRVRGRGAAAAALVPVVVVVGADLLGTGTPALPGEVVGAVLVSAGVLWAALATGAPMGRRPLVAAGLVVAMAASAVVGGHLLVGDRFVLRDHVVPPFDPTEHPSPLAAYRALVKQGDTVMLTAQGLPQGARVRLAVLDRYDGTVWNVAGGGAAQGSGEFRRVGSTIPAGDGDPATVTFVVGALDGIWLPTVGDATSFDLADDEDLRYNDATGGAVVTTGLTSGLTYTEHAVLPTLGVTDEQVGSAPSADVVLPADAGVPVSLTQRAQGVVRDATTPAGQVRALATWLSETGYFSDGLDGEYPSLPGHGAARMNQLVAEQPMVGDSEQYASALALMARSLNLRARVVIGFVPGVGDSETAGEAHADPDASGVVELRGKDVQAWVEVAFEGIGWVAFDATPPTSRTATDQEQDTPNNAQPQVVQPPVQPPAPQQAPEEDTRQPQTDGPDGADRRPVWVTVLIWSGTGLGTLLLVAAPALAVLAAKMSRRRRRRGQRSPDRAVAGGWDEVRDVAVDLRRAPSPLDTRSESVETMSAGLADGLLRARIDNLAARADRATFSRTGPTRVEVGQYWTDVDVVVRQMWSSVPWRRRVVGRASIRSLRPAARTTSGRERS